MSTQLALDPSLPMSPQEFAEAWNADPRTDDLAKADLRTPGLAGADPTSADELVVLETTAATMAVSAAALYGLIQDILQNGGLDGNVRFAEQAMPAGDVLLHVTAAAAV